MCTMSPSGAIMLQSILGPSSLLCHGWRQLAIRRVVLLAYGFCIVQAACPRQTSLPAGQRAWIDPSTPDTACTKAICTGPFSICSSSSNSSTASANLENLVLVMSDEFSRPQRSFIGQDGDRIWTAVDMYYPQTIGGEQQTYKPEKVRVFGGALNIRMDNESTPAIRHDFQGFNNRISANYTSGMVQSWNKFCFTGGLVEFSVKLPGNFIDSGLWAATWLQGNLGRAGYYRGLTGRWPYSYNSCEGSGNISWSAGAGQRTSRCTAEKGRGAPEIDVLEYGIFPLPAWPSKELEGQQLPLFIHTLQMGPMLPPRTTWLPADLSDSSPRNLPPGLHMPGAGDPSRRTFLPSSLGKLSSPGFPRTGSAESDSYTASSLLGPEHFDSYHTYSVLWEPGEYVRWYLDDQFLFEVNKEALRAQTNDVGERTEDRLIPVEAMYLIMNLAASDIGWSKISPNLTLPATMSVDYVRVYQRESALNVGCNPPDYPTADEIACRPEEYFGPSEVWVLPACSKIWSRDNLLLLYFGTAVALVTIMCVLLIHYMLKKYKAAQHQEQQFSPGDIAAARGPTGDLACYVNRMMLNNPQWLRATRPDLLVIAADKANSKAKTS